MSRFTKILTITALSFNTAIIASGAIAGEKLDPFTTADIDADNALDRTEYETYVSLRAKAGEAYYIKLRDTGDYDLSFAERDLNADALLTADEVSITMPSETGDESQKPNWNNVPQDTSDNGGSQEALPEG